MTMDERNKISMLYKIACENNETKNYISNMVENQIYNLKKEIRDLTETLRSYESLKNELKELGGK